MVKGKAESIKNKTCLLGENALWNQKLERFFWADIIGGRVFSYAPESKTIRTETEIGCQIGAFVFSIDGGLILCTEGEILKVPYKNGKFDVSHSEKLFTVPAVPGERFNDAIADARGRVISGSKRDDNTDGVLYSFGRVRKPEPLRTHLGISNGMAFTGGGKRFYHVDSAEKTITVYDYDISSGKISSGRIFFRLPPPLGEPDGITADIGGHLWVACWNGGAVLRISPNGEIEKKIDVPAKQVSSVCFGGKGLSTLFITTAALGGDKNGFNNAGDYLGGEVFFINTGYRGVYENTADI